MKWVTGVSIHYISIQVWLHIWGINAHTDIVKVLNIDLWADLTAKRGQIMFLFKSNGLQRFLLGLCLGVEDGL